MTKLGPYHFKFQKGFPETTEKIVAIDTEWAKNWKAKEKFVPFCLALHSIYLPQKENFPIMDIDDLCMDSELYFRSENDTIQDYIDKAECIISKYINSSTLLVGHQLTSDIYTFLHSSSKDLIGLSSLITGFRERNQPDSTKKIRVADTRYDIKNRVTGNGSEKLRNVSLRLKIFGVQTELDTISLTRMYNEFLVDKDDLKREKLTVMNWRHAFQTALIWVVDSLEKPVFNSRFNGKFLVTNDIIFEMGKSKINYLSSEQYNFTRSLDGISNYVQKYCPDIDMEGLL